MTKVLEAASPALAASLATEKRVGGQQAEIAGSPTVDFAVKPLPRSFWGFKFLGLILGLFGSGTNDDHPREFQPKVDDDLAADRRCSLSTCRTWC